MYFGSDEFNSAIENTHGNAPKTRLKFADDETLDLISSMRFYGGSNDSDDISIGTTIMARVEVSAYTDKLLTGREFLLEQGIELADGTMEYMPIGYFTVQKPSGDIDQVTFTAYDRMQKLEKPYSSNLVYPTTSDLVLEEIANICGIEVATPIENPIEITENLKGYTCREILGYIAGIHGFFACFDRYGKLNVRWYSDTPIEKDLKSIWSFEKSQENYVIEKIEVAKDSETNYISGNGTVALQHSNPYATQDIVDNLFLKLGYFSYMPATIDMLDDLRLDPWDVVNIVYYDGMTYSIPCMTLEHDFKACSTLIKSVGKSESENEYRYTGPTIKYLNRMAAELLVANRVIATKVDAEYVQSHAITTDNLDAITAQIKTLVVEEIDGLYADIKLANIDVANIDVAKIGSLFAHVGLIDRATIVDGHITGFLDAVEINANKITAGTLIADRLLLRGSEQSILYQLNSLSRNILPYPYYDTTFEENGLTFTDNGDGTVTVNGIATKQTQFFLNRISLNDDSQGLALTNGKTYTLSGCPSGGSSSTYYIYNNYVDNGEWKNFGRDTGKGLTFVGNGKKVMFMIRIASGATIDNLTFKPMLSEGTEVIPYEPYRERTQALTSETINGEVLTDRTITADKIIAKSITTNELDVNQIFGNEAVLNKIVSQDAFINAIETNRIIVGTSENANKALQEVNKTVKSITMHYLATTLASGVTISTSGWTTTVQQIDATKKYLWTYQTITYVDNTTTDTSPVISGVYGNEGKDGEDGTNGVGITSVIPLYYLKSNTTAPSAPTSAVTSTAVSSGVWTKSMPTYVNGYTYFTCTQTQYTNGTYGWSTVVADNALTNANKTANTANKTATTANNTANGIKNNIYKSGTTLIDGGKIYTGSITADKIDVDDLFAQEITATGTITGATLVSIEDNSSKVVIDKGTIGIYDFDTRGEGGFYEVGSIFASGGGMVSTSGAWIFESLSTELGNDVDEMAARLNKITQRNFVLIGDSYLAGQTPDGDIDSWGVYLKNLLPEYSFSIHAIKGSGFGSTVSGKNFLDALKQYSGDKNSITDIIVCGGYNDAATSITTSAVLTGIANFISYVNQNFVNANIHIGYVGATNNGIVLERIKEAIRIYRACGSKGCGYISNMEYTIRNTQFFTSDGVHPNQIGQKNIAWNLASYLTTGNVSVIQEKENCNVVAPSTVTAGITLYTGLNNDVVSLHHPTNEYLKFSGLSATKMNGAEGSRVALGTLTNSSIIGNQTTSSVSTSVANASVSVPINVKTASGWHTGIGTIEIISLNVVLRLNILNNGSYLNEAVTGIIMPPFTATFDSLDV